MASAKHVRHYDYVYITPHEGQTDEDLMTVLRDFQFRTGCPVWNISVSWDDTTHIYTLSFSTTYAEHPVEMDIDIAAAEAETDGYELPDIDENGQPIEES